jgi:hypothetical protein
MRFIQCPQGSEAWLQARSGIITASCFADAISALTRASGHRKAGDPSATSDKYASDIAIEQISGKPYGEPVKAWALARGHELEPHARARYEASTGNMAMEAGVVLTDDGTFGYSTDGLVNPSASPEAMADYVASCEGLIEIKCPIDSQKIFNIRQTGDLSEYLEQMQGGMWLTGAEWCDFIMYVPDLEAVGNDLYVKRVLRDEDFIEDMAARLMKFRDRVADFKYLLSKQAA